MLTNSMFRLVNKNGNLNIVTQTQTWWNPFSFNQTLRLQWVSVLMILIMSYLASWLVFAFLYLSVEYYNGNVCLRHKCATPGNRCLENVIGFNSALLFSIETQMTIGLGHRVATNNCPHAVALVTLQSLFGIVLNSLMTGIVLNKFTQFNSKQWGLTFSSKALVMLRSRALFLAIRVGDSQDSKMRNTEIHGVLYCQSKTQEGEVIPYQPHELRLGFQQDGRNNRLPLLWPLVVVHKIDETSPLYSLGPKDISSMPHFELVLYVSGTRCDTGSLVQSRTSYLAGEIVWGAKFTHNPLQEFFTHMKAHYSEDSMNSFTLLTPFPQISAMDMEKEDTIDRNTALHSL